MSRLYYNAHLKGFAGTVYGSLCCALTWICTVKCALWMKLATPIYWSILATLSSERTNWISALTGETLRCIVCVRRNLRHISFFSPEVSYRRKPYHSIGQDVSRWNVKGNCPRRISQREEWKFDRPRRRRLQLHVRDAASAATTASLKTESELGEQENSWIVKRGREKEAPRKAWRKEEEEKKQRKIKNIGDHDKQMEEEWRGEGGELWPVLSRNWQKEMLWREGNLPTPG